MARINEPFQVLVVNNGTLLTKDKYVSDLTPGQLGLFDKTSGKSVEATSRKLEDTFLGVGYINDNGIADMKTTQHLQKGKLIYKHYKAHREAKNQKIKISDFTAMDSGTYSIHVEYHNVHLYSIVGFNRITQFFEVVLPQHLRKDPNNIVKALVDKINSESNGLIVATATAREQITANKVTGITAQKNKDAILTQEEVGKIIAYNAGKAAPDVFTDIQLEFLADNEFLYSNLNLNYYYPRQTNANITPGGDFLDNYTITEVQASVASEGKGYDVQYMEYQSFGYEGNAQKVSTYPPISQEQHYAADKSKSYDLFTISYNNDHMSGWQPFSMPGTAVIAVESAGGSTIITNLKTMLGVS